MSEHKPKNIRETKVWQQSSNGIKHLWSNYMQMLKRSFQTMPRTQQEQLIGRICLIVTIGVSMLLLGFVYSFLPQLLRVFVLPGLFALAYWAGTKLVTPIIIIRYEQYLNRDF